MVKDMIIELAEAVINGSYSPQSVWEDYYKQWSEAKQEAFDVKLLSVIIHADKTSDEYMNAHSCYGYLSRMRTTGTDKREVEKQVKETPKKDTRRNVSDYFFDVSRIEEVRKAVEGKTGAALVSVLRVFKDNKVLNTFPSYGSMVKDWRFPDDRKLENAYRQAKKGK